MDMAAGAAVVMAKPKAEFEAEAALRRRGYRVCLPLRRKRLRDGYAAMRPLFVGYLFVLLDDAEPWVAILSTPGVDGVVRRMGERDAPALLAVDLVAAIRDEAEAGVFDDVVPLDAALARPGDRIKVADGPFAGFITTLQEVDERGRAQALLRLFNRETVAAFSLKALAVVPATMNGSR
jgi:transcription antitermination factor NusG